jgi:hypothetical protein
MAAAVDVHQKQCAVIEFLCCENETVGNIHKRLKNVHGDGAVDRSTVSRWARRLSGESGHANIRDSPRTGRPHTAQTPDNVQMNRFRGTSIDLLTDRVDYSNT